jgi:Tol biopolymer transport system component
VLVDGTGLHRVFPSWNPSGGTCCGNWTPDGKYFVFQADGGIWAVREKAGLFRRASREPVHLDTGLLYPISPLPSADGKRVFCVVIVPRNEFVRFDLKSGQFALDLAGVSGTDLEFSRDGKWVTYVSVPEGSLFRSAPDGSQRLQLTSGPLQAGMPHWSHDGKQVAFIGSQQGKPDRIYIVSFEGGAPRQVTNGESGKNGDSDPSWSPDGTLLAFGATAEVAAKRSIHVLDLKTSHVSGLPGSEGMWSPRWSPDGRFIAGLSELGWSPVVLYDVRARTQTELSHLLGGYPSWSRDGESLFFQGPESTWWRVRIRDRHLERIRNMKDMRLAGWGWFATAPNNSLITARNTGTEEIYALDWELP